MLRLPIVADADRASGKPEVGKLPSATFFILKYTTLGLRVPRTSDILQV